MPDARSRFTSAVYQQLCSAPLYDPALDLVVEAADGTYAATIGWSDPVNGIGLFEPAGTRSAFRRQGRARSPSKGCGGSASAVCTPPTSAPRTSTTPHEQRASPPASSYSKRSTST